MDKEKALKEIQSNIAKGNVRFAYEQIRELANQFSDDTYTLLTCVSLLKTIEEEKGASDIAGMIRDNVKEKDWLEAAKGLRSIGFPLEAEKVISKAEENNDVIGEKMRIFFDLRKYSESISSYKKLTDPTLEDKVLMIDAVSSNKEYALAAELAKGLLEEAPGVLKVQRCYCAVLSAAGKTKEAERYVKDNLKKNKSSPDADALAAYQLWIEGKSTSAGAYASKAIKGDQNNTMAMEILAYCLVEKGKLKEAKIVAGAINEKEPGNPAVVRILDMCRLAK